MRVRQTKKNEELLCEIVSSDGVVVDPEKVTAIQEGLVTFDETLLLSFLGLVSHYRIFVKPLRRYPQYSTASCRELQTSSKTTAQKRFSTIKYRLKSAPILPLPDFEQ